jgi:hypothetical protein
MKANERHYFSDLFDKVLYMFRTRPLSIIRSISTLYTRKQTANRTRMTNTYCVGIVLSQHLTSSLSVNSCTVRRLRADSVSTGVLYSCLQRVTMSGAVIIQFDLLKMSMVLLETCRGLYCNTYVVIE